MTPKEFRDHLEELEYFAVVHSEDDPLPKRWERNLNGLKAERLALTTEFERLTSEIEKMKPVYDAAMEFTRAYDEWDPELDPDADEQGHWECWLRDACRWAKRRP